MKNWFALDITVETEAAEAIESALNQLDSLGTEIDGMRKTGDGLKLVTGFFETLPHDADIRAAIDESLMIYGFQRDALKSIEIRIVEETDWLAEWKKHWKPTQIGKFIIAPPWTEVGETDKIVIRIEPNMAFGTGTHETTQLCLQAISDNYKADQTFLDVGTGTGILAIAAAKLATESTEKDEKRNQVSPKNSVNSVAEIFGFDTDADSIKIAKENAVSNGVGERIAFVEGSIDDNTPSFDFVCANLTIDVIVPMLPMLLEKTGKLLLLSGILAEQQEIIAGELQKFQISNFKSESSNLKSQISNFKFEIKGEWIAVIISMG